MGKIQKLGVGIAVSFCLIISLLITAVEAVCYWTPGYFEKEYEKYEVLSELPEMTMSGEDGLMAVTEHMMKYLRGDKDAPELQIEVMMGGERRGFFTERELLHMEDVQKLFLGAITLRRAALMLASILSVYLLFSGKCGKKKPGEDAAVDKSAEKNASHGGGLQVLASGMLIGSALFLLLCAVFGILISADFSEAFVAFHHIFFDNDLWILNPEVDMLVNIVPEGFFFDTAFRILILFVGAVSMLCALSGGYLISLKKRVTAA